MVLTGSQMIFIVNTQVMFFNIAYDLLISRTILESITRALYNASICSKGKTIEIFHSRKNFNIRNLAKMDFAVSVNGL